jgi:hypothetical protein
MALSIEHRLYDLIFLLYETLDRFCGGLMRPAHSSSSVLGTVVTALLEWFLLSLALVGFLISIPIRLAHAETSFWGISRFNARLARERDSHTDS